MSALAVMVVACAATACLSGGSQSTGSNSSSDSDAAATYSRACNQAVGGTLPAAWRKSGLVVGSLALYSFGQVTHDGAASAVPASAITASRPVKMLALVRPGAVVSLIVPPGERRDVSLSYRPGVTPATVSDGDAVVTFHACSSSSGGGSGVAGWTQFNGDILVASPRCAKFLVNWKTRTAGFGLAFGRRNCD